MKFSNESFNVISRVITEPTFLIKEKNRRLYFFRLIGSNINLLVEAHFVGRKFVVKSCTENPSVEYVSGLLRTGALLSF